MKIYSILLYSKSPSDNAVSLIKGAFELSNVGFFYRSSVQELLTATGKIIVERTPVASRCSVREQDYLVHVYIRADGLACVVVCDAEYPSRVAFTLAAKVIMEFLEKAPQWRVNAQQIADFKALDVFVTKYQDPNSADAMTKIQNELDETKLIMHDTIQKVLERGEKLDDLIDRSEGLSEQSKMFYKSARKMNSCCTWM